MNRRWASLLALAVVAGAAAAAAPAAGVPGFTGCRSFVSRSAAAVVRPRSIVIACADANFYATGLKWTRWDIRGAEATGVGHENDCTPYCAAGRFHTYRLAIRLDAVARCGSRKELQFTRMTWTFPGAKPPGVPARRLRDLPLRLRPVTALSRAAGRSRRCPTSRAEQAVWVLDLGEAEVQEADVARDQLSCPLVARVAL